mgnify:CR=1 FL=1
MTRALSQRPLALVAVLALALSLGLAGCDGRSSTSSLGVDGVSADSYSSTESSSDNSYQSTEAAEEPEERQRVVTSSMSIETTSFDDTLASVRDVAGDDGLIDYEDVYEGTRGLRSASITLRVPAERMDAVLESLRGIEGARVVSERTSAADVTEESLSLEGELDVARARLERVEGLYESATTIDEHLQLLDYVTEQEGRVRALEEALADVGNDVTYSTLTVDLTEVEALGSDTGESALTRMGSAFATGWVGFIELIMGLVLFVIVLWPVLVIAGVIIGIVVWHRKHKRVVKTTESSEPSEPSGSAPDDAAPDETE